MSSGAYTARMGRFRVAARRSALRAVSGTRLEGALRSVHTRVTRRGAARYDRLAIEIMRRVLRRDSSCIDVGCYRGQILREMLRLAPAGHQIAFEPVPANYEWLVRQFPGVLVHHCALSDAPGTSSFQHVQGRPARSGLRRVPYPDGDEVVVEIDVALDTLDRRVAPDVAIDLIKIDVEGAELQVLSGGARLLTDHHPVLLFEHAAYTAAAYGTTPAMLHALLVDGHGYGIWRLDDWLAGRSPLGLAEFVAEVEAARSTNFVATIAGQSLT
jgi:FkbM family methyltransferase